MLVSTKTLVVGGKGQPRGRDAGSCGPRATVCTFFPRRLAFRRSTNCFLPVKAERREGQGGRSGEGDAVSMVNSPTMRGGAPANSGSRRWA